MATREYYTKSDVYPLNGKRFTIEELEKLVSGSVTIERFAGITVCYSTDNANCTTNLKASKVCQHAVFGPAVFCLPGEAP